MKIDYPILLSTIVLCSFMLSGCVKLQLNPGDVVGDSVDAGKELYQTIKRKRNGEEERQYTFFVESATESEDTENILTCKQKIKENIEASPLTLSAVLSESGEVVTIDEVRKVRCEMVVLVVPA